LDVIGHDWTKEALKKGMVSDVSLAKASIVQTFGSVALSNDALSWRC
jgi:hypothetical protein